MTCLKELPDRAYFQFKGKNYIKDGYSTSLYVWAISLDTFEAEAILKESKVTPLKLVPAIDKVKPLSRK